MISKHLCTIDYHDLRFKSSMNVYLVDFGGEEGVNPGSFAAVTGDQ